MFLRSLRFLTTAFILVLARTGLNVSLQHIQFIIIDVIFLKGLWQKLTIKTYVLFASSVGQSHWQRAPHFALLILVITYLIMWLLLDLSCLLSFSFLAQGSSSSSSKKAFSSSVNFIRFAFYKIVMTKLFTLLRLYNAWLADGAASLGCSESSNRWGFYPKFCLAEARRWLGNFST